VIGAMRAIVLIGMPGAGKSTVGVLLAKRLGVGFVDTDILVQERAGRQLQEILDAAGYRELRRLEEEAILALEARGVVVATGGSAVYSGRAMGHLGASGVLVYLRASPEVLAGRIDDYGRRGVANPPDQSFGEIVRERAPLYERWADVVVEVDGLTHEGVVQAVAAGVRGARVGRECRTSTPGSPRLRT
jgi:shikimate kinase